MHLDLFIFKLCMNLVIFLFWHMAFAHSMMMVRPEAYSLDSPCPNTFQYQMDENGEIYGKIGIYSLDENIVQLKVELSVGNQVQDYNGEINLVYSKSRTVDDILHGRPVRYKVIFPRWERTPPKVTEIMVNGQVVCRGSPLKFGGLITILTTIHLQHTLTVKVTPLQSASPNFRPDNRPNIENPFIVRRGQSQPSKNYPVNFNPEPPQETFIRNPFFSYPNTKPATLTTTESTSINSIPSNDFIFSKNPFLNGNAPDLNNIRNVSFTDSASRDVATEEPVIVTRRTPTFQEEVRLGSAIPFTEICGLPVVPNPLVVKGTVVPRGAFPWLAAMFSVINTGLEYKCSGSLISHKHIVTAAHCVEEGRSRIRPDKLLFVLGKINIQRWALLEGERMVEAARIHVHSDYIPNTSDADIAVVILSEDIQFSKYIRPICLWSESDDLELVVGEKGKVVGWGKDENGDIMTAEPKQSISPIVSQEQCLRSSETFNYITSNRTFCAGNRNGSGPCNGDSGSGFIMKRNDRWVLRGVVSISTYDPNKQTCDLTNYVVFTDASKFIPWLVSFT